VRHKGREATFSSSGALLQFLRGDAGGITEITILRSRCCFFVVCSALAVDRNFKRESRRGAVTSSLRDCPFKAESPATSLDAETGSGAVRKHLGRACNDTQLLLSLRRSFGFRPSSAAKIENGGVTIYAA